MSSIPYLPKYQTCRLCDKSTVQGVFYALVAALELRSLCLDTGRLLKELVFNDLLENALKLIWYILGVGSSSITGNENVMKREESTIKRKRTPCRLKAKYKQEQANKQHFSFFQKKKNRQEN